jgi:putative flippase GtrA
VKRETVGALFRFASVGFLNTLLDFAVFAVGVELGLQPLVSTTLSWAVAVSFSYVANSRWTFGRSWNDIRRPLPYVRFVLGNGFAFLLATTILVVLLALMPILAAKAVSVLAAFTINFLVAKYLVFDMAA